MRYGVILALLLGSSSPALADMGACANIASNDLRRFCVAQRTGNASECASIGDPNQRRFCYAKIRGNPAECASIMDREARDYCRGVVGR